MQIVEIGKMALAVATEAFLYPLNVFYGLLGRTGTLSIYWAFFLLVTVYRLLIAPLIGATIRTGASDTVKKHKRNRAKSKGSAKTEG